MRDAIPARLTVADARLGVDAEAVRAETDTHATVAVLPGVLERMIQ